MMNQTKRLICLADEILKIPPKRETLQLLFLLICAEHIAKLFKGFAGEGQSRAYVRKFFKCFLSLAQQQQLCVGIMKHDHNPLSLQEAVDALYKVRCDVVHEGKSWGFHFRVGDDPLKNWEPDVIVH
jgi:hypothetical protein